ncbi:TetR/AcrR family transcriptional regulator [Pseudoramibacter sp.]|jgi:AcrR family transcriptional regulator|uniref:TetR/AcrR family transcriptional regulator n=1 Tax=Pseudoramibacter sp. TaxID=2034862 RepID=UPI0025D223B9|nr:TetR/AcrR family transcriptional regulator [Pseudoramibacter sp.]MCH4072104.1 TetR/AcrR family transcriptional regulator [Pseudoramibacter sp.]MCH4105874.1 TetR/AcrR family transcriptional regulator [Pseudoramibacter sp.]
MKEEKPHMTKRQLQAITTKNKIYEAALQVINEKGFDSVSIEDITNRAEVSKGSFYTYFESKEALLFETFRKSDEIYEKAFEELDDEAFLQKITHFVRISYSNYESRGKGIIKAIVSNYFSFPDKTFYGEDRALLKCLKKIVLDGKREKFLSETIPTQSYVNELLSTLIGIEVMWCISDQGASLADMAANAIEVTARGMMQMTSV